MEQPLAFCPLKWRPWDGGSRVLEARRSPDFSPPAGFFCYDLDKVRGNFCPHGVSKAGRGWAWLDGNNNVFVGLPSPCILWEEYLGFPPHLTDGN